MKLVISAGEASGDQRGAEVLQALKKLSKEPIVACGFGGNNLENAGMQITHHLSDFEVMGLWEILFSLKKILILEKAMHELCIKVKPDCILLVDYPGFNLRLGRWAKKHGIKVIQYVAPQMWAWGAWRTKKLKKSIDLLLTLFAFEEPFFQKRGVNAIFTGHPLAEIVFEENKMNSSKTILALFPGSRKQEVKLLLPVMLEAFQALQKEGIIEKAKIAVSSNLPSKMYLQAKHISGVELISDKKEILTTSNVALVCSGTATLETALYNIPFVVCYKTSPLTYSIAKLLVKGVKNICLASIVAGREVAPELIQKEVTVKNIISSLKPLLQDKEKIKQSKENFNLVRRALGKGNYSENAAKEIIRACNET